MSDAIPKSYEEKAQLLARLLESHGAKEARLPQLEKEPWWLEEQFRELAEWLRNLLSRDSREPSALGSLLEAILPFLGQLLIITVAIIVIIVAFFWLKAAFSSSVGEATALSPAADGSSAQDLLRAHIERALREADFARAMRLRWKLFLADCGFPGALTLREYTYQPGSAAAANFELPSLYQAMFSGAALNRSVYDAFHMLLEDLLIGSTENTRPSPHDAGAK